MTAMFTLVRNQIGWEENLAKKITTFTANLFIKLASQQKRKTLHAFKVAIASSLNKKKNALQNLLAG